MRLLLDAHLPRAVAQQLCQQKVDAVALADWQQGSYRSATDEAVLEAASPEGRVLVTYDRRTIPRHLRCLAEAGGHHAGVILIDERIIRPNDIGGLVRALLALVEESGDESWDDQVVFLRRA